MIKEKIEALDIYWYVTHGDEYMDCPDLLKAQLLDIYVDVHGQLPRWNKTLR